MLRRRLVGLRRSGARAHPIQPRGAVRIGAEKSVQSAALDAPVRTERALQTLRQAQAGPRPVGPLIFCGLNGATDRPRRRTSRHSPATSADLSTCEPVPWISSARKLTRCP